jgi:hypothetical protein
MSPGLNAAVVTHLVTQARPFIAGRGITAALLSPLLSRPLPYQRD